jgi:mannose-6-phosphate isomerase-like protein (cupin superfamily)
MDTRFRTVKTKPSDGFTAFPGMRILPLEDGQTSQGFSLVRALLQGSHPRVTNRRSSKTYYIISGSCSFATGEHVEICEPGDCATVGPGVELEIAGNDCYMLIIVSPPYDPADEI